jgi:hypothetical protein
MTDGHEGSGRLQPDVPVFDAVFQRYAAALPNGRAYARVVIAATPSTAEPLDDRALDAFDAFVTSVASVAEPVRATPEVAWWRIADPSHSDLLSMWLHPGPVIEVLWGVEPRSLPPLERIDLRLDLMALVAYWRTVLGEAGATLAGLGHDRCAVALGLQTVPATGGELREIDTSLLPDLRRSGAVQAPPPWGFQLGSLASSRTADPALIGQALDRLLRHYSYRRTEASVEVALRLAPHDWSPHMVAAVRAD